MGNENDAKTEDQEDKNFALKEKIFKIMTVLVYLGGVGGAGFMASLYFIIFWVPEVPKARFLKAEPIIADRLEMERMYIPPSTPKVQQSPIRSNEHTAKLAHEIIQAIRANYSKSDG